MSISRPLMAGLCWLLFSSSAVLAQTGTNSVSSDPPAVEQSTVGEASTAQSAVEQAADEQPADAQPVDEEPPADPAGKKANQDQQAQPDADSGDADEGPRGKNAGSKGEFLDPAAGSLNLGGEEGFGIGTAIGDPTALFGPDRTEPILNGTTRSSTVNISSFYAVKPADNQRLLFEVNFDPAFVGIDASYAIRPKGWDGQVTFNTWLSSAKFAPFQESRVGGVLLPNREEPFLQQGGAGIEYSTKISDNFDLAAALNYQNYAFSDSLFGGDRFPVDLTDQLFQIVRRSPGEVYSMNLHGIYSTMDDRRLPTKGAKVRLAAEQGVALGNSSSSYTRLAANITGLIPMPGFNDGYHALLLNVQAGTILGTAPSVRSFHLGGPFSVRGYNPGEMASGTSFVGATAEYRHDLTDFTVFEKEIGLRAAAFVDYGSVLGTQRQVRGIPQYLYDKPTDGMGYGVGLHFVTDYGLFKLESAWNNRNENTTYLSVGERF